jgi:hypothetical protein
VDPGGSLGQPLDGHVHDARRQALGVAVLGEGRTLAALGGWEWAGLEPGHRHQRRPARARLPAPVGVGHHRRPEAFEDGRVDLEVRRARDRRQRVGVGHAQHRAALGRAEGPQPDPVGEVALQAAQASLVEPLGGEQQVDAEAAPEPADGHEQVDELWAGGQ